MIVYQFVSIQFSWPTIGFLPMDKHGISSICNQSQNGGHFQYLEAPSALNHFLTPRQR